MLLHPIHSDSSQLPVIIFVVQMGGVYLTDPVETIKQKDGVLVYPS